MRFAALRAIALIVILVSIAAVLSAATTTRDAMMKYRYDLPAAFALCVNLG
ncbi:MAG: hypothetical protein ACT4OX_06260 [Actinomycetota bacterium]